MNRHASALVRIARGLKDPILSYDLERGALVLGAAMPVAVVNPGVKSWEQHVEETVAVLKSLDQEIEHALDEYDTAEEFAKFFEDGIVEEEELKRILDRTRELGKVASTAGVKDFFLRMFKKMKGDAPDDADPDEPGMAPEYVLDDSTIDDFLEGKAEWADASHYIQQEFQENKEFFTGAQDVVSEMDKARRSPTKAALEKIHDRVRTLIKAGQRMLQGIRKHLLEPAPRIELEEDDDEDGPVAKRQVYNLEGTVSHYVDMLRDNLEDPEKLVKYLKELFSQVEPLITEDRPSIASARAEARRRILPVLIRFAHARPGVRALLLPVIRQATGR